jgi:crotonobetainyl-CoA:carnitine CoA-transferase CaiB-like acyl-CoA transferase
VTVVDLTIMWAGPLATWLLASLGAEVVKVEPGCRPDGLRGSPAWFATLDRGKGGVDLDLRHARDRRRFFELVARADLVVDNFSPRVAPNLGIDPAALRTVNPDLATLSMPAFPAGRPERDWVAYGTGAHAISGLGDAGTDGFFAPAVTYPDPIAGFTAFAVAAALLVRRQLGAEPTDEAPAEAEVSLSAALEPLRRRHDGGRTLRRPPPAAAVAALRERVLGPDGLPDAPVTIRPAAPPTPTPAAAPAGGPAHDVVDP